MLFESVLQLTADDDWEWRTVLVLCGCDCRSLATILLRICDPIEKADMTKHPFVGGGRAARVVRTHLAVYSSAAT
jgi:hypothetical protein